MRKYLVFTGLVLSVTAVHIMIIRFSNESQFEKHSLEGRREIRPYNQRSIDDPLFTSRNYEESTVEDVQSKYVPMVNDVAKYIYSKDSPTDDEIASAAEDVTELWDRTDEVFFEYVTDAAEEVLQASPKNIDWQVKVEEEIEKEFMAMKTELTELVELDCREKLCKVILQHENENEREQFTNDPIHRIVSRSNGGYTMGENIELNNGAPGSRIYFTSLNENMNQVAYEIRERIDMHNQQY